MSKKTNTNYDEVFFTSVGRDAGDRMGENEGSFEPIGRERGGSREW